ncbi:hypothetical protein PHLCEN_2v2478 [Hermanssonia centrifuga]|uniref:Uncharacterized protein n=1 Tax=Hermanssonia centrifuga TaxID=98765 RepID=A0A2R6RLT7_9APHY|nr:hypothetical protein PHLCEN_2v2478 [Hermanssonia centrifuga]
MGRRYQLARRDDGGVDCGSGGGDDSDFHLRVASIFIILAGSMAGALFPVLSRRTVWLSTRVPKSVFDFAKYFGSGVIIATAFIHLLDPAIDELNSPCLAPGWSEYPYALAIALFSIFTIFIVEIIAFRWGSAKLARLGITHDPHGHGASHDSHKNGLSALPAHGPGLGGEVDRTPTSSQQEIVEKEKDLEANQQSGAHGHGEKHHQHGHGHEGAFVDSAGTQIIGIAILEFGVLLHSILVGLTLAVTEGFKVLFVVIVFHQTFEGLGVGSRLAYMELPRRYNHIPMLGALLYGITTPIGIAVGLGIRSTYNPGSTTASIVSGVLDAFSAGILIYTGLVEAAFPSSVDWQAD